MTKLNRTLSSAAVNGAFNTVIDGETAKDIILRLAVPLQYEFGLFADQDIRVLVSMYYAQIFELVSLMPYDDKPLQDMPKAGSLEANDTGVEDARSVEREEAIQESLKGIAIVHRHLLSLDERARKELEEAGRREADGGRQRFNLKAAGVIKELEQSLGVQLFDRTTRKLQLSEVGREFYPLVDKLVRDLDGVLGEINSLKALKKGVVRVAVPQLIACTILPQVIAAYRENYPDVQVKMVDCGVESVVSGVLSGEVDVGIGPERDLTSGIDATPLFEVPFMLVFPKGHPLQNKARITWADAVNLPFISLKGQYTERLAVDLHARFRDLTLNPSNEVNFMTTALAMIKADLGVTACLPYAESLVKMYQLEMRRLHDPVVTRKFFVFSRHGRSLSPAASSFMEFLHEFIERQGMSQY